MPATVERSPEALAAADFNGDGILDLAAANFDSSVSIVLGAPAAGLPAAGTSIPLWSAPTDLAVADFNADGHPDLAVTHSGNPIISVLLGTGTGEFQTTTVTVPYWHSGVSAADFTGDGRADIVAAGGGTTASNLGELLLLAGDGSGGFAAPHQIMLPLFAYNVAAGDFNGDGLLDLAAVLVAETTPGALAILLADGSGGFGAPAYFSVGHYPDPLAIADLNADGHADVVVANRADRTLSVLFGDGTGAFGPQQIVGVGGNPSGVAILDANVDGLADIAVTNRLTDPVRAVSTGVVQILVGDGAGAFASPAASFAGVDPTDLIPADFNRDGRVDLAVADRLSWSPTDVGQVGLLLNTCGEQADVSVAMTGSADPLNPFRGNAFTLTADVTNKGPHAVPVVLQLPIAEGFSFEELTVSQGRCRPGTQYEPFNGTVTCWLGVVSATPPGNTARLTVSLMTQSPGVRVNTVKAFGGGLDPVVSDNFASVTSRVGFMGGNNFKLTYLPGGTYVTLDWSSGDFQRGYSIARYVGATRTVLPADGPLPPTATTFTDPAPIIGQLNCYFIAVLGDGGAVVGRSNGVCVQPGTAVGTPPLTFSVTDNGGALLGWEGPGAQTGYVLVIQPTNGDPQRRVQLPPSRLGYYDGSLISRTCYVLAPYNVTTEMGRSDIFCAVPGFRDLDW